MPLDTAQPGRLGTNSEWLNPFNTLRKNVPQTALPLSTVWLREILN